uniref:Uncharacterized protein n=1 Tax=Ditylenchus dipsaci TaxID=166011 RepID=A0A915DG50_9BILA
MTTSNISVYSHEMWTDIGQPELDLPDIYPYYCCYPTGAICPANDNLMLFMIIMHFIKLYTHFIMIRLVYYRLLVEYEDEPEENDQLHGFLNKAYRMMAKIPPHPEPDQFWTE